MKKVMLVILDGWGIAPAGPANAISAARTPCYKALLKKYAHSQLITSGEDVGLPAGQMGNSEVGHLNIGAGRVVYQDLAKISKAVREHTIDDNLVLQDAFRYAKTKDKALHLLGLVSDGGIHSHEEHLYKICELAEKAGVERVYIHAFTDGRDCDPKSGITHIERLENRIANMHARIASICGRYYAMDRDKRWERVKKAYSMLVHGEGMNVQSAHDAVLASYKAGITDEFIEPAVIIDVQGKPLATIKEGDAVLCFNFRTDRCREITEVLTQKDMPEQGMQTLHLHFVTMTNYDNSFKNIEVVFHKDNLTMTLGEAVAAGHKTQLRIAETEKYPHVTFFFSGGREEPFAGEQRIMIPSPKVATYDLKPSMSAIELKDALVNAISTEEPAIDFVCANFANPDMVGHTGVFPAVIEALETVDACLQEVIDAATARDYVVLVIADHGNADHMLNDDGSPNTAHTTNPVPCILVDSSIQKIQNGRLCDLAPTILQLMGLPVPMEMSGKVLI